MLCQLLIDLSTSQVFGILAFLLPCIEESHSAQRKCVVLYKVLTVLLCALSICHIYFHL